MQVSVIAAILDVLSIFPLLSKLTLVVPLLGPQNCGWLKALKASARNSNLIPSRMLNCLNNDIVVLYALVLNCDSNGATSPAWGMKEMTANDDFERFRTGAAKYAAYLETPEGRLRLDLAFANLQDFLPQATRSLLALDLGCGTGAIAVRLARLGLHVTLLDASVPMLDFAKRAAREAGVTERIALKHGDAAQFANLFHAGSFDVILCHNILEYVDDPCAVLRSAARALRDPSSIISVLVRNQAGEVLKAAIQDGDLAASEHNLSAEWGHE